MSEFRAFHLDQFKVKVELSVFGCDLSGFPAELELARQAVEELRQTHPESTPSNVNAVYMSPWKSHCLNDKLSPLIYLMSELIRKASLQFFNTDLTALNYTLGVADCWGAIYEEADYTVLHSHFPSDFSTVIYLDVDAHAAPIVFGNSLVVQPVSGSALVFPGLLEHHVPATKGRRVVVAINFIKLPAFDMQGTKTLQRTQASDF